MLPVILNLAATGLLPVERLTPKVPVTQAEIVRDVLRCAERGVTIVHLHARDDQGRPTHRREAYAELIGRIREKREDLVLCVSCSGRSVAEIEDRFEVLSLEKDLRPDMASLTLSSLNFPAQASVNAPDVVRGLAERMLERGIAPELEIFDLGMANYARYLLEKGILRAPLYANVFFGNVASAQPALDQMAALLNALPGGTLWSFAGIGRAQRTAALIAVALGGGVRTGLEDNLWADDERRVPADNPSMVEWVHQLSALHGRAVMSPDAFRSLLRLPAR